MNGIDQLYAAIHDYPRRTGRPVISYVLAATPRTGGTFLSTELWRTGRLGAPLEYLNLRFVDQRHTTSREALLSYWQSVLERRTSPNGVFGVKMFISDYKQVVRTCPDLLPHIGTDFVVYLYRRDKIAQAVSYVRAAQSGQWSSMDLVRARSAYDFALIKKSLRVIEAHELAWRSIFEMKDYVPHRIAYEDLIDDTDAVVQGVEMFVLGAAARRDRQRNDVPIPILSRQSDATSAEWVDRFSADYMREHGSAYPAQA